MRAGKGFRRDDPMSFTIDPGSRADMNKLVATLANEDRVPSRIVHAWSVTG